MDKSELIQAIIDEAELSKHVAVEFIDVSISMVTQGLEDRNDVTLVGFGTFHTAQSIKHQGCDPKTGEPLAIAARKTPKFRPDKVLENAVNG